MATPNRFSGTLDDAEQKEFLAFARQLAEVSAAVIRPYVRSGFVVER